MGLGWRVIGTRKNREGCNMDDELIVLCATDNRYAPYCGIMLTSLLENNKDIGLKVYVLINGKISNSNKRKFQELSGYYGCFLEFVVVNEDSLSPFVPIFTTNHVITLPTYYRLLAAELLPSSVHRAVYLDCDMIVRGSLRPLLDVDLNDVAVAVVKDCVFNGQEEPFERLGYPKSFGYFNAGMLVMNLDYWRKYEVRSQLKAFIEKNYNSLFFMDQDALNGVLYSHKLLLPERFNLQTEFFYQKLWEGYPDFYRESLIRERDDAVVIHYCGSLKPWLFMFNGLAFHEEWEMYRKISLWKHCRSFLPLGRHLKWLVGYALSLVQLNNTNKN